MTALREDAGNRMLTENNSPAYRSTLSSPLDLFSASRNIAGIDLHVLLRKSWESDPALTLRIIYNIRSIHEGKSEKETFYRAFGWLFRNHPRTAIGNLNQLVEPVIERPPKKREKKEGEEEEDWTEVEKKDVQETTEEEPLMGFSHGYYKDLLNILLLASVNELTDPLSHFTVLKTERPSWTYDEGEAKKKTRGHSDESRTQEKKNDSVPKLTKRQKRALRTSPPESHAQLKVKKAQATYDALNEKLTTSPQFRALFVAVARIFASKLSEEITILKQLVDPASKLTVDERKQLGYKIGLVSKWAPTLGGSHDRATNIGTAIATVLLGLGQMKGLESSVNPNWPLSKAEAERIRSYYRRWIIGPLRRQAHIPEIFMSAQQWDKIIYSRVPSLCMANSKGLFFKHDEERFSQYVGDVAAGKRKISGAVLGPNATLAEAIQLSGDDSITEAERNIRIQVLDAQFNSLVGRLRESGSLDNCLAICDVSGSMGSLSHSTNADEPIYASISLSIIVAQLARPPFQNIFITFSGTPEIIQIDPSKGLVATANKMVNTNWGMNTDLQAVFVKLLLPLAKGHNIKREDMVKRLFIFSDMQFDDCRKPAVTWRSGPGGYVVPDQSEWVTDHDMIVREYANAGYDVPEIVSAHISAPGASI